MTGESSSIYEQLQNLLPPLSTRPKPGWLAESRYPNGLWGSGFRSFSQVIFINHPLSGALLLWAFLLESPWMALLAMLGMIAANLASRVLHLDPGLRDQGIHGFNGALVGCAAGVLLDADVSWFAGLLIFLVPLGGAITAWLLQIWSMLFHRRGDPPALTLPFCLITWGLLLVVGPSVPDSIETAQSVVERSALPALFLGVPHSFGQVFLCANLASSWLVLLAVVLASPLAAALGVLGALAAMVTVLAIGVEAADVAQGLWGYNGLLVAIALGGIFHAPGPRSLMIALVGAGLSTLLQFLQGALVPTLPPLTVSFVLTTWMLQRLVGRLLPALIPVSLHAVVTPEEHRHRFRIASELLGTFRSHLRHRISGTLPKRGKVPLAPPMQTQTQELFQKLDHNHDGILSLDELAAALLPTRSNDQNAVMASSSLKRQLAATMDAMDLDGDGRIDACEFGQMIQQLQRLREGEERLLLYLMPADADGDDRLDQQELALLLRSIGQPPLSAEEERFVFSDHPQGLSWRSFVDRLLLT